MNAMTCNAVAAHLDLLAAGACDRPTRRAVEKHLQDCPACSARFGASQRLLGLLELHWDDARKQRLRERIDAAARQTQRRRVFSPFVRRAAALAALLLVTLGLGLWLPRWNTAESAPDLELALLVSGREPALEMLPPKALFDPNERIALRTGADAVIALGGKSGEAFRRDLRQSQREGRLPLPPAVSIELVLKNTGNRPLLVRFGDAATELTLDVRGNGVLRLRADGVEEPGFLRPHTLPLAPGGREVVRIDRLSAGSRGRIEYIYLTEPGEYSVRARLRASIGGQAVVLESEPLRLPVRP